MPELPETEVLARGLRDCCIGAVIERLEIIEPSILGRETDQSPEWYIKAEIEEVRRHGKAVLISTGKDGERRWLGVRLGMSGRLLKSGRGSARAEHTHAVFTFLNRPFELHYRDPRRFGKIILLSTPDPLLKGADPLAVSAADFASLLSGRRGRLKGALMHQGIIAGLGNICANEALHATGLHPHQAPYRLSLKHFLDLHRNIRRVLRTAIRKGGTTIRDFRSLDGVPGSFQNFLKVYGRSGRPCLRKGCGGTIALLRPTLTAQASFFCPRCQPVV